MQIPIEGDSVIYPAETIDFTALCSHLKEAKDNIFFGKGVEYEDAAVPLDSITGERSKRMK